MLNAAPQKQTLVAILLTLATTAGAAEMPRPEPEAPEVEAPQPAFDDWQLTCADTDCVIDTRVLASDGTEVLRIEAGGQPAVLRFVTTLGLHLPDGLTAGIGADTTREIPWLTCGPEDGCRAEVPLDADLLAAVRRERAGSATLTLVEGVPVRLGFSLMGFSAAWRALADAP